MWVVTRERKPDHDGFYLVQMTYGTVSGLEYTKDGGWNTNYDLFGILRDENAINDLDVARWFDAPQPPEVPDEWFYEMIHAKTAIAEVAHEL